MSFRPLYQCKTSPPKWGLMKCIWYCFNFMITYLLRISLGEGHRTENGWMQLSLSLTNSHGGVNTTYFWQGTLGNMQIRLYTNQWFTLNTGKFAVYLTFAVIARMLNYARERDCDNEVTAGRVTSHQKHDLNPSLVPVLRHCFPVK